MFPKNISNFIVYISIWIVAPSRQKQFSGDLIVAHSAFYRVDINFQSAPSIFIVILCSSWWTFSVWKR